MMRMIVTDLDDTLLRYNKTISDYTVATLNMCRKKGIVVCYATARAEEACVPFIERFMPDVGIFNNGAVACGKDGVFFEAPIERGMATRLNTTLISLPSVERITAATSKGYFINFTPLNNVNAHAYQKAVKYDFTTPPSGKIYKYTVEICDSAEVEHLTEAFPMTRIVCLSQGHWYAVTDKGAGKWTAIKAIAIRLGIPEAEICVFGDDLVDTEMLCHSGLGVAVANAIPQVKEAADTCCGHCNEDGVARWLREHYL